MMTPTKKSRGGSLAVATPAKAAEAKSGLSPATKMDGRQRNVAAKMAVVPLQGSGGGTSLAPWEDYCQQGETDSCFGQPPAPRTRNKYGVIHQPQSRYQLQPYFDLDLERLSFGMISSARRTTDKHCPRPSGTASSTSQLLLVFVRTIQAFGHVCLPALSKAQ